MSCKKLIYISLSLEDTIALGKRLGSLLFPGAVICLTGELGSGKTSFVKGIAKGFEVPEKDYITSPTFTIINEYPGRHPFYHVDLYRIGSMDEIDEIGLFEILHGDGVAAVEWADRLDKSYLPEHTAIHFQILDNDKRKIFITFQGDMKIELLT